MPVSEIHVVEDSAAEFDLDVQITVAPDLDPDKMPRMDGFTTYVSCQYSCTGTCGCCSTGTTTDGC